MKAAAERKLLTQVLRQLESPKQSVFTAKWFLPVSWVGSFLVLLGAFQFGHYVGSGVVAAAFIALGVSIGFIAYAWLCAKQEPIMRNHLDRESINRRLAELGS